MPSLRLGTAVLALMLAVALGSAAVTAADQGSGGSNGGGGRPDVLTQPPNQVGLDRGTLQGKIRPQGAETTYVFEWGTTTEYGQTTEAGTIPADSDTSWVSVAKAITGLQPNTTYHFRLAATTNGETVRGADKFFTTALPDGTSQGHGGDGGAGSKGSGDDPKPELGKSLAVSPADGVVRVRRPGKKTWDAADPSTTVPTGTVVDATNGEVTLTTAVTPTTTQQATFWGGRFEVRQTKAGGGYTDIYLRDSGAGACPRKLQAGAARKKKRRGLWGRDSHGRYRTHGRNSVATVRGTTWLTTERCGGTVTWVRDGAVAVRDKHRRKSVLVRAGHAYLARAAG
jgi:hypothetical protein